MCGWVEMAALAGATAYSMSKRWISFTSHYTAHGCLFQLQQPFFCYIRFFFCCVIFFLSHSLLPSTMSGSIQHIIIRAVAFRKTAALQYLNILIVAFYIVRARATTGIYVCLDNGWRGQHDVHCATISVTVFLCIRTRAVWPFPLWMYERTNVRRHCAPPTI